MNTYRDEFVTYSRVAVAVEAYRAERVQASELEEKLGSTVPKPGRQNLVHFPSALVITRRLKDRWQGRREVAPTDRFSANKPVPFVVHPVGEKGYSLFLSYFVYY